MKKQLILVFILLSVVFIVHPPGHYVSPNVGAYIIPLAYAASNSTSNSTPAQSTPEFVNAYTLNLPCYDPTKITFNYAATHNSSLTNISTYGSGLYSYGGSSNYLEFDAKGVDTYSFTVIIIYDAPRNQSIVVSLWSGDLPMMGMVLKSIYQEVIIYVTLSCMAEPVYPTPDQVSAAVVAQLQKQLGDTYTAINNAIQSQNAVIMTISIVQLVCIIGVLCLVFIFVLTEKRRQQNPEGRRS